jgi:hypothetical protein
MEPIIPITRASNVAGESFWKRTYTMAKLISTICISIKEKKEEGGREKKQNNQPLQISVKLMVKIVNRSCTSSDAAKQPRQRKSIHGSLPYETIKFNALSTIT